MSIGGMNVTRRHCYLCAKHGGKVPSGFEQWANFYATLWLVLSHS
jgi:hypothetical protein